MARFSKTAHRKERGMNRYQPRIPTASALGVCQMGLLGLTVFVLASLWYVRCKLRKMEDDIDTLFRKEYES